MSHVSYPLIQQNQAVPVRQSHRRLRSPRSRASAAFTLIELMISIALVVLLILGVSQVFQYTTQAVGAGEAVTAAIRNSRSAQSTFDADFSAMVGSGSGNNDAASLIISSRAVYAFRDARDQNSQGQLATNQTYNGVGLPSAAYRDLNGDGLFGDGSVNGEVIPPCTYNYRNHRLDTLSFFARNAFSRQTGNVGTMVDSLNTTEAWIWYGHLWLPDNAANYNLAPYPAGSAYPNSSEVPPQTISGPTTFPGAGTVATNPNNFFASQWVLGRVATLLREKSSDDQYGLIYDSNQTSQRFIDRANPYPNSASPYAKDVDPLASSSYAPTNSSAATLSGDTSSWFLQDGRFDLAATTIASFRSKLSTYVDIANTNATLIASQPYWYDWMLDGNINPPVTARPFPGNASTRFKCNPFLGKPFTSATLAQATPYFLGGCSQFIVEYAGDFLTQDNDPTHTTRAGHSRYGDVIGLTTDTTQGHLKPDGQIDFFINANGAKQTIWYGMPRNTSGQTSLAAYSQAWLSPLNSPNNANGDVVPLRDWIQYVYNPTTGMPLTSTPAAATPANPAAAFEKIIPSYPYTGGQFLGDYSRTMSLLDAQNGYTAAWSPTDIHPKIMLIRITITLEDPTGRLPEGQTFQYVFPVAPASTSN